MTFSDHYTADDRCLATRLQDLSHTLDRVTKPAEDRLIAASPLMRGLQPAAVPYWMTKEETLEYDQVCRAVSSLASCWAADAKERVARRRANFSQSAKGLPYHIKSTKMNTKNEKVQTVTRTMLAVSHAVTSESRYDINHVRIDADGRVMATDGHVLAITSHEPCDVDCIPEIPGFQPGSSAPETLLNASTLKRLKAATGIPKGNISAGCKQAVIGTSGGDPAIAHTDLDDPVILPLKSADDYGQFPDVDRIIPSGPPGSKIGMTVKDFGIVQKILKDFSADKITLELFGPNNPFQFTCSNDKGENLKIVVMPCKLDL